MSAADRPLYEDLLRQRAALESLVQRMIRDFHGAGVTDQYQAEYDEIIAENRKREGLT